MIFLKNKSTLLLNVIAVSIIFFLVMLGGIYTSLEYNASLVWPASGFIVIIYFKFKNRVVPAILIGTFLANFFVRFIIFDFTMIEAIILVSAFSFIILGQAYVFFIIFSYFDEKNIFQYRNITIFALAAFASAIFASLLSNLILLIIIKDFSTFLTDIQFWFLGDFFGIVIFGSTIYLSFQYDPLPTKIRVFKSTIVYLIFVVFTYLLLSQSLSFLDYQRHSYIFAIFFIFISPSFNFRMIFHFSITYLILFYHFVSCPSCSSGSIFSILFDVDLFLLVMVFISLILKLFFINTKRIYKSYEVQNIHLNKLITSTQGLLSLSDDMLVSSKEVTDKYIVKMFRIALSIFDKVETGTCYVVDEDIRFLDSVDFDLEYLNNANIKRNDFFWDFKKPFLQKDAEGALKFALGDKYPDYIKLNPPLKESVYISIFLKKEKIGGISFDLKKGSTQSFTESDLDRFSSFQTLMNSFYQLNFLNEKNLSLKNDIVLALIRALDLFDKYTKGHSEDVANLSKSIGKRLNLSTDEIYDLYWAGIIHDIGKVGVRSDIINKPGILTDDELRQIRLHSTYGFDILNKIDDLKHIAKIVKHHHERYDGGGYPDGIKGEDIPYLSRIICVADAVSSMATDRTYRPKLSEDNIIEELIINKGKQFDPDVVDTMIECIKEGRIRSHYE